MAESQRYVSHAIEVANEVNLDPVLLLAIMATESSFNPNAQSRAGAQGLMQVLTRVHTEKFEPYGGSCSGIRAGGKHSGRRIDTESMHRQSRITGSRFAQLPWRPQCQQRTQIATPTKSLQSVKSSMRWRAIVRARTVGSIPTPKSARTWTTGLVPSPLGSRRS
jgi:hypothetical protein